jgi:hypothetical protein
MRISADASYGLLKLREHTSVIRGPLELPPPVASSPSSTGYECLRQVGDEIIGVLDSN